LKILKEIQATYLKDPITHPRGERHLHDGQTAIVENIVCLPLGSYARDDYLVLLRISFKDNSCLKVGKILFWSLL